MIHITHGLSVWLRILSMRSKKEERKVQMTSIKGSRLEMLIRESGLLCSS